MNELEQGGRKNVPQLDSDGNEYAQIYARLAEKLRTDLIDTKGLSEVDGKDAALIAILKQAEQTIGAVYGVDTSVKRVRRQGKG